MSLNYSTMLIFSHVFLLLPQLRFSPSFCHFSITCGMFVCLYKLLLLPLDFILLLLLCLLYLLGYICTVLMVNLSCLSRKRLPTAIIPDDFLSIFLQLLKKLYFLKPYKFTLRVLHNSVYSNTSFPPMLFCMMLFILLDISLICSYIIYSGTSYFSSLF